MRSWMTEKPLTTLLRNPLPGAFCLSSLVIAVTATPVAAQSSGEVGGIAAAMIGLPLFLGLLIAVILYLASLYSGGYFRFFVEAGGSRVCNGGKTFIA